MLDLISEHMGTVISFVVGGGLATGASQLVKATADAKKTRTEADQLQVSMSAETETITVATMKEAIQTMRDLAEDANTHRERAETSAVALRDRLDALEATNRDLCAKVARLEADDKRKDAQLAETRQRVSVLETNLASARHLVARLERAMAEAGVDPDPPVDFSIFDV